MSLLVARGEGYRRSYAPVSIGGSILTRNFVLWAMSAREFATAARSGAATEGQDVLFWGRVSDSAGVGLPSVWVMLEGLSVGGDTDREGYYHFAAPAKLVRDQRVVIMVRQMGLLPTSDTSVATETVMRRDYVAYHPIYDGDARKDLVEERRVDRAAGLSDLSKGPHQSRERELRVRIGGGVAIPYLLYRFIERSGKRSGEVIAYWPEGVDERETGSSAPYGYPGKACRRSRAGTHTCRVRFTQTPDWDKLWNALDSLDIWTIPDEGPLHKRMQYILDANSMLGESWNGQKYNAWAYAPGVEDHDSGRARVSSLTKLLRGIDTLLTP